MSAAQSVANATNFTECNVEFTPLRSASELLDINAMEIDEYLCNMEIGRIFLYSLGGRSSRDGEVLRRDRAQRVRGGGDDGQRALSQLRLRRKLVLRAKERCRRIFECGGIRRRRRGCRDGRGLRGREVRGRRSCAPAMVMCEIAPGVLTALVTEDDGLWLVDVLTWARDCRSELNRV
jgi:hypothetical protein